jgi:membrane associated rhomboid family serine protease
MRQASVGFHCPECAGGGRQQVLTGRDLRARASGRPMVTLVLLVANVGLFLLAVGGGGAATGGGLARVHLDYGVLGAPVVFLPGGAGLDPTVGGVALGEWWRVVTGGFLHGNMVHLGMNMFVLWLFGQMLERTIGHLRFALVYGVGLVAGSFGALLLEPFVPTVGASGAIYGLFGLLLVLQRRTGVDPWSSGIVPLLGINLLLTFAIPGISIGGHLGGLAGGVLAALVVLESMKRNQPALAVAGCGALALACVLGSIWASEQALETLQPVLSF